MLKSRNLKLEPVLETEVTGGTGTGVRYLMGVLRGNEAEAKMVTCLLSFKDFSDWDKPDNLPLGL